MIFERNLQMEYRNDVVEVKSLKKPEIMRLLDGLSVVVPAFNEDGGIGTVLQQLQRTLASTEIPYEIIVVDDGSTDRTAEVAGSVPGVRVLHHRQNRGYGASIKSGIRYARYEIVCITDADGTYPNNRIPDLLTVLITNNCDMVVGARVGEKVAIPLVRRPAKWAISQLARVIAGTSIPDINSGLRIFKRTIIRRFYRVLPDGFSFTTTITLGMLANDYSVSFTPIEYYPRVGKSKIKPIRDTLNFVQLILRIALYFSPLKIFLPLSGFFLLLGLTWGALSYLLFDRIADASMAVIIMTAIQIAVVGLLADLINHRLPGLQNPAVFEDPKER
jgi:glycosyltransferase involved in cell wall biosynthesis